MKKMSTKAAQKIFSDALALVESDSIRKWASSQPTPWLTWIKANQGRPPMSVATTIVTMALGM